MFLQFPKKSSYFGNDPGDQYLSSSLLSINTSLSLTGFLNWHLQCGHPISPLQTNLVWVMWACLHKDHCTHTLLCLLSSLNWWASIVNAYLHSMPFKLIQNRCKFWGLYGNIKLIMSQMIGGGVFLNLNFWFCLKISEFLWPFEFMLSITIAGSFLPCWLHSCLVWPSLLVYGFSSPSFFITDLYLIWWLVCYLCIQWI